MLKYRAISFPVLMALLGVIFFSPEDLSVWVFTFCVVAVISLATYECARMIDNGLIPCLPKTAGILAGLASSITTMIISSILQANVGIWVFTFCAIAGIGIATYEWVRMINNGLIPRLPKAVGISAGLFVAAIMVTILLFFADLMLNMMRNVRYEYGNVLLVSFFLMLLIMMICALLPWIATVFGGAETAKKGFTTVAVVWATIVPFGMVAVLYVPEPKFLFFVMMVTKAMDTGGYVFGMLSNKLMPGGNHKLCPSISPKKSWEGFAGGLLLAVVTAWALRAIFPGWDFSRYLGAFAWWKEIVLAVFLALASICGDLTESALKRKCGVKDSGNLIPGMGGPLDVLDSFIYVGPVCLIFSKLILTFKL